ncbi:zinc ion transmembrane transporter [Aureococcus anophagefferens]|nr:zinc ion transmembrane transporter [Aureococcus anophagefferens]
MGLLRAAFDAFLATCFTWFVTACGAALVFILPSDEKTQRQILQPMLGFAGGVMTSASFFSLLAPALEMSQARYGSGWAFLPVTVGFAVGCCCMLACDQYLERHGSLDPLELMQTKLLSGGSPRHGGKKSDGGWSGSPPRADGGPARRRGPQRSSSFLERGGASTPSFDDYDDDDAGRKAASQKRAVALLVFAITLHNFPGPRRGRGLRRAAADLPGASRAKALNLALGIGLQNFPRASRSAASSSPSAASSARPSCSSSRPCSPYALAFAAGAMIYVVVDQLIPESLEGAHSTTGNKQQTLSFLFGFGLMMTLDVALG